MQNIYKRLSVAITDSFIRNDIIPAKKKEIYKYGFEVLISTLVYTAIFIAISVITKTIVPSLVFWIGFFIVRTISGGFHAKTYLSCHLLFLINHLVAICILKLCPVAAQVPTAYVLSMISAILMLIFAPVDHPNKPFIKSERKRFRKYSCIFAVLLLIVSVSVVIVSNSRFVYYSLSFAIGTFSAAVSLVSAKISYNKGEPQK